MKTSQKSNTSAATQVNAFKEKLELIKCESIVKRRKRMTNDAVRMRMTL